MNNRIFWRQPGLYDVDEASLDSALDPLKPDPVTGVPLPSMTIQSAAPETDINFIVRKYGLTGELAVRRGIPEYGNFDESMDFQALLANVKLGEAAFLKVPADIRARFNNDAGAFLEWIHEDSNYDAAEAMGLVPKRVVAEAVPNAVVEAAGAVEAQV